MENGLLPDLLEAGLKVVFCGTAAGRASAEAGCYYAHSNNKFWAVLAETGLTDRRIKPQEFSSLLTYGIGLTDLCKDLAGSDREVRPRREHRTALKYKVETFQPAYLAFTSLEAGKRYLGRKVALGSQPEKILATSIYVLPSTSLMAAWNWGANKNYWNEFASLVHSIDNKPGEDE
jgi:TDG/mug DNA glycosylase family protein